MEAFNKLYDEYFGKVYAYFSVCFGKYAAEDLSQTVFMKIWNYLRNHEGFYPDAPQAWIFRAAVNVKNDYIKEIKSMRHANIDDCVVADINSENLTESAQ